MYYIKKALSALMTIFIVSILVFVMFQIIPGDAASLKAGIDDEYNLEEQYRDEMGLDESPVVRYANWLTNALQGDLGDSWTYPAYSVKELILQRAPLTLTLTISAFIFILISAIPLGLLISQTEHRWYGLLMKLLSQISLALPSFWIAILLISFFAIKLKWFPVIPTFDLTNAPGKSLYSLILPIVAISLGSISLVIRYLTDAIQVQKKQDYVSFAKTKGLGNKKILFRHILKNSLIPVVTILGMTVLSLISGSIIVENIFGLSGIGSLLINAINLRDLPLTQGIVFYLSIIVIFVNFMVDIIYSWIDPRIKTKKS